VRTTPLPGRVRCGDPDGDPLTYAVAEPPRHGTLRLAGDGAFSYTAARGFTGDDAFAYTAADGRGASARATVRLRVLARADRNPPACALTTVRDPASGLATLRAAKAVNATVSLPAFAAGTRDAVVARAPAGDPSRLSDVVLVATDVAGNTATCETIAARISGSRQRVLRAGRKLRRLQLSNGRPGLTRLDVRVGHRALSLRGLRAGVRRSLALGRGAGTITLRGYGGSALIQAGS
jgi:hypothetical protein